MTITRIPPVDRWNIIVRGELPDAIDALARYTNAPLRDVKQAAATVHAQADLPEDALMEWWNWSMPRRNPDGSMLPGSLTWFHRVRRP